MTKRLSWAAIGLLLFIIFLFSWAPYGIKQYAEKHYPIRVGSVVLRWNFVAFRDVQVHRDGVEGTLQTVVVDWDRNIKIRGGQLSVNLDALKESEPDQKTRRGTLEGFGLKVQVKKSGAVATLENARFDAREVCFDLASVSYRTYSAILKEGCVGRQDRKLTAKHIEVPFELPFEVPRVGHKQTVQLEGVRVDPAALTVSFQTASCLPLVQVKKPSSVRLTQDQLLVSLEETEVNHPWLSPERVTFAHVTVAAPKSLREQKGELRIGLGPVTVTVDPWGFSINGKDSCNNWVEAMPTPLPAALEKTKGRFTGDLSFEVSKEPSPHFSVKNSCRYDCSRDPIFQVVAALRGGSPVAYQAYDRSNQLFERKIGSATKDWVGIASLPPHIPKAFITLEDPGFLNHRGIIPQALENSLKDNLKLGRFHRGGSTITMQLAKNLWLRRHKTLGRKAEEALLTIALESCLTKAEILELYLNVVEMGPNLYGIGPASRRYFEKSASELEPEEAFYLASILPSPRKAAPPTIGTLNRIRGLMRTLADRGLITDSLVPIREDEVDTSGWETE